MILKNKFSLLISVVALTLLCNPAAAQQSGAAEETLLMFVGETEPIVTVASRTPEAPTTAPAMVTVVSHEQISRRGYQTLAELLQDQPGFFIAFAGRGSVPYLRGQRDSILFLYDGVPLTTDGTRNFAPLGREISLAAVERVEIVRGPGSVLWGPDAFAGVVNIVPHRGSSHSNGEVALTVGSDDLFGAAVDLGLEEGRWKAWLGLSGVRENYPYQEDDASDYTEAVATITYDDWFQLTGRWSDFTRRYTMNNGDEQRSWAGEKQAPVNLLKATISKIHGPSHYTISAFFQETDYKVRDAAADVERRQRNRINHLELFWDRRLLGRGLLSMGSSMRWNRVDGDFYRNDPLFGPKTDQEDYSNRLGSVFSQFRYQWGKIEGWAGVRLDDHSQYRTSISYSLGLQRSLTDQLRLKLTFGNAFRSPWASELFDDSDSAIRPESIRTTGAQLAWNSAAGHALELTLFHSRLQDHRTEDVYGELSFASRQENYGAEFSAIVPLPYNVTLSAGFSLLGGADALEHFKVFKYSYERPDGSQVIVYDEWQEIFNQGPQWQSRLRLDWQFALRQNLFVTAAIGGDSSYTYEKGTVTGHYDHPLLVDLTWRRPGFFFNHETIILHATNLLDQNYQQADVYGPTQGPGMKVMVVWKLEY